MTSSHKFRKSGENYRRELAKTVQLSIWQTRMNTGFLAIFLPKYPKDFESAPL